MRPLTAVSILLAILVTGNSAAAPGLTLTRTIELPGVKGRLDHMDIDPVTSRLFLGALENDSLEVIDFQAGIRVMSITHLGGPQGVAYIAVTNEVALAARDTGYVLFLDAATFKETKRIAFGDEADNLHMVPTLNLLVLGYGNGAVAFIDPQNKTVLGTTAMGGHPEGLQAQVATGRLLVNVPSAGKLISLNLKTRELVAHWSPSGILSNFPMAVQETRHRGAYYTHVPSQIVLFDTLTGQVLSRTDSPGDVDDLFFDDRDEKLYLTSGSGTVEVWSVAGESPQKVSSVPTGPGARTGLLSTTLSKLFVAVPQRGQNAARVLIFATN